MKSEVGWRHAPPAVPERNINMLISDKQHQANLENAQKSTGPITPEGREAIRFNALTYGLRTRQTILERENAAEYSELWDELEADWQPQTRTERCYLETMVTSQWLLRRIAESEQRIYTAMKLGEDRFKLLAYVYKQRAQLERSFRTAIADMKQSQKERKLSQPQPPETEQPEKPAQPTSTPAKPTPPQTPPPDYVMSGFSEPATTDSR
jgi:hypothetical protein